MDSRGVSTLVLLVELIFITVEFFHGVVSSLVLFKLIECHKVIINRSLSVYGLNDNADDASLKLTKLLRNKFRGYLSRYVFLLLILTILLIDWFMILLHNFSIEYYIPIRIFVVILINSSVRKVVFGFFNTVRNATKEFTLYFSSLVFFAVVGMVLLGQIVNVNELRANFSNFVESIMTSFIFFASGTNYTDTVVPAFNYNKIYSKSSF
jgi:hypothetical protein